MGRPTKYTEALADSICDKLMDGMSMRQIAKLPSMPDRSTMLRWMSTNKDFAAKCAHAREEQADLMDDLILETANACTPETASADKVKISAYQWRAAKLKPKKYGDKVEVEQSGEVKHTISFKRG